VIVDLLYEGGISKMCHSIQIWQIGDMTRGTRIIGPGGSQGNEAVLNEIQSIRR
jgi:ketol-acid reductoisomerase